MFTKLQAAWLTGVGHASAHAWELIFPAIAIPVGLEFGLNYSDAIELGFLLFLFFGLGAAIGGPLVDYLGAEKTLLLCLLGGAVSSLSIFFVTTASQLYYLMGALGFFASFYHPAGFALLSHVYDKNELGRAMAINGIYGQIGIAFAPLASGLFAAIWGWKFVFVLFSLPAFLILLTTRRMKAQDDAVFREDNDVSLQEKIKQNEGTTITHSLKSLIILVPAFIAVGFAYRLHTLVLPGLLQNKIEWIQNADLKGFGKLHTSGSNLLATLFTSFAYLIGIFGQWWGGRVADRFPRVLAYALFHGIAAILALLAAAVSGTFLIPLMAMFSMFAVGMQPIENAIISERSSSRFRGRVFAAKFLLTFGLGSLATYAVKPLLSKFGFSGILMLIAALECIVLIFSLGLHVREKTTNQLFQSST